MVTSIAHLYKEEIRNDIPTKNLRFLLKQNQVSYREVSKESGVSIKVISAIINNSNLHVTLNSVVKLANYFKINLDDFIMKDIEQKYFKSSLEKAKEDTWIL